jgi:hypothetical protein
MKIIKKYFQNKIIDNISKEQLENIRGRKISIKEYNETIRKLKKKIKKGDK